MKRVNLKTIGEMVGVSASTVSRVLNGKSYVNEKTRKKVLEAISKTNYQPNELAQSLKMGSSTAICLMIPSIQNLIFAPICKGLEKVARERGYIVVLCNTDEDEEMEKIYIEKMRSRWTDGFVFACAKANEENVRSLQKTGVPIVLVNRYNEDDIDNIDIVGVDNFKATYDGMKYLISRGCKRIAFAMGEQRLFFYRERLRGYKAALHDSGLEYDDSLVMYGKKSAEDFYHLTQELIKRDENIDAIFASSDPKAIVIMRALHDMGIRIPEDVSVLGFDDVELSAILEPPLSTVRQPFYQFGITAGNALINQIEYKNANGVLPPSKRYILDHEVVVRKSTK